MYLVRNYRQTDPIQQFQPFDGRQRTLKTIWTNVIVDIQQKQNHKVKTYFPLMRMKTIMKLDENVGPITTEAAAAMSFMAELFIRELSCLAWLESDNRRSKIICKMDFVKAAKNYEHMDFLIDILPSWIPFYGNHRSSNKQKESQKKDRMLKDVDKMDYLMCFDDLIILDPESQYETLFTRV